MISSELLDIPLGMWRQCGNPKQFEKYRCFTEEDIINFVKENDGINPCYISVCAFSGNVAPKINKDNILLYVPFDFDSKEDRNLAFKDAITLTDYCKKRGWKVICIDTTNKGYHVWIPCYPKRYSKYTLKAFQKHIKDYLMLETADEQIFGQVNRLMRIPMTHHEDTGKVCGCLVYHTGGRLVDLDDLFPDKITKKEVKKESKIEKEINASVFPCLEVCIQGCNPTHWSRFAFTALKIKEGKSDEELKRLFETYKWKDWNESETIDQIRQIRRNGYEYPTCKSIIEHDGLCIKERCLRYPKKINGD